MKKTINLRKILLLVALAGICATGIINAQALKVRSDYQYLHIGLNDPQNNITPGINNHYLTFGNGGGYNLGLWGIGVFEQGLNINRINNGTVKNPANGIIFIDSNWNVGIGLGWLLQHPQYRLDVRGNVGVNNVLVHSDKRYKKDIEPLNEHLDNLAKLNSVKYKRSSELFKAKYDEFKKLADVEKDADTKNIYETNLLGIEKLIKETEENTTTYFGFIAQELREVYPDLVSEDTEGYLAVNYIGLIPVLVDAIKELKTEINELKTSKGFEKGATVITSEAKLYQNNPNPFTANTEIKYYLPNETKDASIRIYNLVGEEIAKFDLLDRGYANLTINGSVLKAGMYNYALLVDGQLIDTKQMVLTK